MEFRNKVAQEAYEELLEDTKKQISSIMTLMDTAPESLRKDVIAQIPHVAVQCKATAMETAYRLELMAAGLIGALYKE